MMTSLNEILESAQVAGKRIVIVGLGITGVESARYLSLRGHSVIVVEKVAEERFRASSKFAPAIDRLRDAGVEIRFGVDGEGIAPYLVDAALVVVSPGVPLESTIVGAIRRFNVSYVSELELGVQLHHGPVVVVTGSNGKSTTSTLINHILYTAGCPSRLCGNIGFPVLFGGDGSTPPLKETGTLVVEASSYQLEACTMLKPDVSVILNISDNHLERHGSLERYATAKARAIRLQSERDLTVLNIDDPMVREISRGCRAQRAVFGSANEAELSALSNTWARIPGAKIDEEPLTVSLAGTKEEYRTDLTKLIGRHNRFNMAAAILVARHFGVDPRVVQDAINTFAPLEHRLEVIWQGEKSTIINDAKSTTVAASLAALTTVLTHFPLSPVTLMVGGLSKAGSWQPLLRKIREHSESVVSVVCFGRDRGLLASHCRSVGVEPLVASTLQEATQEALGLVREGGVALLSPGCASFDEFLDFEHRGSEFKRYVRESVVLQGGL